jgi:hypothetical protein
MSLTIGRIVHYWPRVGEGRRRDMSQPYIARVVYVAKGEVATLIVDDHRGQSFVREDVLPESMMASGIIMQRQAGTWSWPAQPHAPRKRKP